MKSKITIFLVLLSIASVWACHSPTNNYRFTQKEFDKFNDLYYYGTRFYFPDVGIFITPEPTVGADNLNLQDALTLKYYDYCRNNPLRFIDPDGAIPIWVCAYVSAVISSPDFYTDYMNLSVSASQFFSQPTVAGAVDVLLDVAGLAIPAVPGSALKGAKRLGEVVSTAGEITDAAKAAKVGEETIEMHHLLPKEFVERFKWAGLNIEDFKIPITKAQHRLKAYGGIHTGPNNWNKMWAKFFDKNPKARREQILQYLEIMKKEFKIE